MEPKPQDLNFLDFNKFDIRVGIVNQAEEIPKSKKLLKLNVWFGDEIGARTILAGIAEAYSPSTIIGMEVMAVLNLAPRTMMGIESRGMLLAGRSPSGILMLVNPHGFNVGGEIG